MDKEDLLLAKQLLIKKVIQTLEELDLEHTETLCIMLFTDEPSGKDATILLGDPENLVPILQQLQGSVSDSLNELLKAAAVASFVTRLIKSHSEIVDIVDDMMELIKDSFDMNHNTGKPEAPSIDIIDWIKQK